MMLRPGKLLLLLLIPVALYGVAKGVMYYQAKSTIDDIVVAAANHADVRYTGIDTDLGGAVTVNGISVQPRGFSDAMTIDSVRVASDDPLFFITGGDWQAGGEPPPDSMSFVVTGISLPLQSDLVDELARASGDANDRCSSGLRIDPALLRRIGFESLSMDMDGHYRLDPTARTLEMGIHFDIHDVESMSLSAKLTEFDAEAMGQGAPPQFNLGSVEMSMRVSPEFGRQALKACASGTDRTVQAWGDALAARAIAELQAGGVLLGSGLQRVVRDFHRDWGEIRLEARPSQPVGLLSLMFLPPSQLADTLSLRLSHNGLPVTDTSFTLERPDMPDLSALFGAEPEATAQAGRKEAPRRIIVRRDYEKIAAAKLGSYVDHIVRIKPQGQPLREGVLKRIRNGEAEVEQTLHGGRFTVYVPLAQIESAEALVQREIGQLQ